MKKCILTILLAMPLSVFAQGVNVNDVTPGEGEKTTIEIRKEKTTTVTTPVENAGGWETHEGDQDLEADAAPLEKDARANWKKACEDWKKEFKADNKDNRIISMNCGKAVCASQASGTTCTSKATYKIKAKM